MKGDVLKKLLLAHAEGDETGFHKAALHLASAEDAAGQPQVAEELRGILRRTNRRKAQARAVADIGSLEETWRTLEGGHRKERLGDVVLPADVRHQIDRILHEHRFRAQLERWGVGPRRRILFHGPHGSGKTLTAAAMAGEVGLPLMSVRVDALFSRHLGATANHLRVMFGEMPRRPGVYLFDEFDALAKARGDTQDLSDMGRVVTTFLQLIDSDVSSSLVIVATNHAQLLDRAMFRRFDLILPFEWPDVSQIESLLKLRLAAFDAPSSSFAFLAERAAGFSSADIVRACDDAIRTMALDGRDRVSPTDVEAALADLRGRENHLR